jgi:hypothetical protein
MYHSRGLYRLVVCPSSERRCFVIIGKNSVIGFIYNHLFRTKLNYTDVKLELLSRACGERASPEKASVGVELKVTAVPAVATRPHAWETVTPC